VSEGPSGLHDLAARSFFFSSGVRELSWKGELNALESNCTGEELLVNLVPALALPSTFFHDAACRN
jgi:hypothetical protein